MPCHTAAPLVLPPPKTITCACGAALLLVALAGACEGPRPEPAAPSEGRTLVAAIAAKDNHKLDVLFVIDNSGSMAEEQASLIAWAHDSLFGVLENELHGRQDVHLGVVTTSMGVYGQSISGCDRGQGNGRLQVGSCPMLQGNYLADAPGADGTRVRNFDGAIEDAFACIAAVGDRGCGFEQPLAAALKALDGTVAENAGFLRDDALLAVVFVTDEDDCSARDGQLFTPDEAAIETLGELDSYRCFRFGVRCGDADLTVPGALDACEPWEESPYLTPVTELVAGLRALKADPSTVVVTAITAPAAPVSTSLNSSTGLRLDPSCESELGVAYPGVRMQALLDGFPARNRFESICAGSLAQPIEAAARLLTRTATRNPCLVGELVDLDPTSTGVQPDCRVLDIPGGTTADGAGIEVPACAATAGAAPCYTITADAVACDATPTRLAITVQRAGAPAPAGTHLEVLCALAK